MKQSKALDAADFIRARVQSTPEWSHPLIGLLTLVVIIPLVILALPILFVGSIFFLLRMAGYVVWDLTFGD